MNLFSRILRLLFDYPSVERLSSSMAEDQEPNLNDDGTKSYFQKTVVLSDWWLIKCPNEFEGKRFGVAGTEDLGETRAKRVFRSSPIIKALDFFTLIASDGINIILRGFLNNQRVVQNGFTPEISREFIFGFPPCWEQICNNCFGGDSSGTDVNAIPSSVDKAESRDKSNVTETNIAAIDHKDGCSRVSGKETTWRKSLHLRSNSARESAQDDRKLESSKSNSTVVELINDSGPEIEEAEGNLSWEKTKRKIDFDVEVTPVEKVKKHKSNAVVTPVKEVKKRKSNAVVTPVKELKKQKRNAVVTPIKEVKKQNNVMVTPVKEVKKQNSSAVATSSADSLGQKRSRSGRVLVSPLEFWRNQIPVYDLDRNLVQIKEGCETNYSTPSKGKGSRSASRKPRR